MQHPPKKEWKKRRHTRLWLLLTGVSAALAVALVALLPAIQKRFPAAHLTVPEATPAPVTLHSGDASALESITLSQLDGETFTVEMQNGALALYRDGMWQPLDELRAQSLLEAVTQVVAQRTVATDAAEVAQSLADMGLEPPQATAVVRYTDGTEITLEVGYDAPNTTFVYCRWSGDTGVYLCDEGLASALFTTATRLLPVEQPVITGGLIDGIQVERATGGFAMSFFTDVSGYTGAVLTAPEPYPVDPEQAADLLTALQNFRLGTREAVLTDESRARYGLDDPLCTLTLHQTSGMVSTVDENGALTAKQQDEQTLTLTIGRAEGDYFYTCAYGGDCYFVSRFLLETLLAATPDTLAARCPADMGDATLARIVVEAPQGTADVQVTRTERVLENNELETDGEGNVVYDTTVTLNGVERDEAFLDTLTNRLRALTVSGSLPAGWAVPQGEAPRWRITLVTQGGTQRTIEGYRLDAFSDALVVDGSARHYAHEEAIDLVWADLDGV